MTNFPKKVFSAEDYDKPLDMLGLVPAAAVIVMKWTADWQTQQNEKNDFFKLFLESTKLSRKAVEVY